MANDNNQPEDKGKGKNRKRKAAAKPKADDPQPSTSQMTPSKSNEPAKLVDSISSINLNADEPVVKSPDPPKGKNKGKGGKGSKKKEAKSSGDVAAFDLEEEEIRDSKKTLRAKASAEDAFAELECLTGISFNNIPSDLCLRPKFKSGRGGQIIPIATNFFRLKLKGNDIHQYDVAFLKPDADDLKPAVEEEQEVGRRFKRITKRMNQTLLKQFVTTTGAELFKGKSYAFDNDRILITNRPLTSVPREGQIFSFSMTQSCPDACRVENYLIRIKPTNRLSLTFDSTVNTEHDVTSDRSVLQVIDIISKTHAFQENIIYGSKIFFPAETRRRTLMRVRNQDTPFEMAFGYHQSTQFCQGGPMQNIDRATAVLFRGGSLLDRMAELLDSEFSKSKAITPDQHEALKDLYSLRFYTNYRGFTMVHTIKSITRTSCEETYFKTLEGRSSVYDYFVNHYRISLKYPKLPCIEYSPSRFIPIELCHLLPDQRNQRKLKDDLIRIVSTHSTTQKPHERCEGSKESAETIANQKVLDQFGIQLVPVPVNVQSRVLMTPKLKYSNVPDFTPMVPGDWNMIDKRFISACPLKRWILCSYVTRKIETKIAVEFVKRIQHIGRSVGMEISNPLMSYQQIPSNKLSAWFETCKTHQPQIIVIFSPEASDTYSAIKSLGDRSIGIPTQVIADKHFNPRPDSRQKLFDATFLNNILLKVNVKIGGSNLQLWDQNRCSILHDKTMVVGIDVNHPSPGEDSPSIAAVVGSLDPGFTRYRTEIKVNKSREELVDVDEMIIPILEAFKKLRGCYPEHIIVYRDGVSEGQFSYVLGLEIFPLRALLTKISPIRPPKLTYIIVQKRHNARFFPQDRSKQTRSGNILPGSVIDTEICHFKWFDFYLCSQNSFLGTARPGKYTVLWHSSTADANELQMATYYLCYLFARSTKSIADPAPARYAHHAAARGKVHLKEIMRKNPEILSSNRNTDQVQTSLNQALSVNNLLKNILYFI